MRTEWAVLFSAVGGAAGIAAMILLAHLADEPIMLVPFATSIALVMGAPDSPQAQPRNIIVGHVVSVLLAMLLTRSFGGGEWIAVLGVGTAIFAMHNLKAFHPPAAINPLVVSTGHLPLSFIFLPVGVGAILLVIFAWCFHGLTRPGTWPARWL